MTSTTWLWGLALACACACGPQLDDELDADDGWDKLGDHGALEIFVSSPNGARVTGNLFASKADVYLNSLLAGAPIASGALPARDYYFHVVDTAGNMVSTDDPLCRRVRIGETGRIEQVAGGVINGAACPHNSGVDLLNRYGRGITVGLAPFADASSIVDGAATYAVELFPDDGLDGAADPRISIEFLVVAPDPPPARCGDGALDPGEGCDDGNTAGMDGCDARCEVEHLCCCGNGALEPGEACDDGNPHDGDGCSSQCALE